MGVGGDSLFDAADAKVVNGGFRSVETVLRWEHESRIRRSRQKRDPTPSAFFDWYGSWKTGEFFGIEVLIKSEVVILSYCEGSGRERAPARFFAEYCSE